MCVLFLTLILMNFEILKLQSCKVAKLQLQLATQEFNAVMLSDVAGASVRCPVMCVTVKRKKWKT